MKTETAKAIVVKDRRTKAYLCQDNQWSASVMTARLFQTPYEALHFCVVEEMENADIMFRFEGDREVRFLRC